MTTDTFSPNSRSELIKRLGSSMFNYWFGYVANLALVIWMVSHAFRPHATLLGPREFFGFAVAGLFSWTLSEYLLHRYLYHVWPSFLSQGHEFHHQRPRDHGSHHWRLRGGRLGRMKRHHLIHHAFPRYNWGFTTTLWDHVFRTYVARRPDAASQGHQGD